MQTLILGLPHYQHLHLTTMFCGNVVLVSLKIVWCHICIEDELAWIHALSMHYTLGDWFPSPSQSNPQVFPYTHSISLYSTLVQLYLRSGQLPTQHLLYQRGMVASSQCHFGCDCAKSLHHLFIISPQFEEYCDATHHDIQQVTASVVEPLPLAFQE